MSDSITINSRTLRVFVDDITMLDVDAFVFYARPELTLGAGFGTAISVRGGPSIQEELNGKGPLGVTKVITTAAGDLKADFIIHPDIDGYSSYDFDTSDELIQVGYQLTKRMIPDIMAAWQKRSRYWRRLLSKKR